MTFCAISIGVATGAQVLTRSLDDGWTFSQGDQGVWYPAVVPGVVHTDLYRNGLIPDPHLEVDLDSVQWIENVRWTYRRTIQADSSLLRHEHVDLVFNGLDTYAEVWIGDSLVGSADNMFRTWTWPVRHLLRPGANEVQVRFTSPIEEGRALRNALGIPLPHDNDPSGTAPYVRKAAYHYGWDFCPRLVTTGIWKAVELRCWSGSRIGSVRVRQTFAGGGVIVGATVDLEGVPPADAQVVLDIDGERTPALLEPGGTTARASLLINDPRLWWPQGEGEQVLYPVRVELRSKGRLLDHWERPVGLRTIDLDRRNGAFTFEVNDRPIFCKGANLVPPSMFLPEGGDDAWVDLVRDMQRAHFNMVRVWAGGVYPPDAFFEACDTAGILVWQDLMFASMPSPAPEFIATVNGEVEDQVLRLRHHASLALWCGNNELEVAWRNWGWQDRYGLHGRDSAIVAAMSVTLFEHWLPRFIGERCEVPYVHTSPLSNWGNAEGLREGDLHYWGVWHGDSTINSFTRNVGRFVSEYGFQSYPDSTVLAGTLGAKHLRLGDPLLARMQRSYKTDAPIWKAIEERFGSRPVTLGGFIEAGQRVQAEAYRMAAEAHLAARPHCMGTLFWQLNDPWPGPSWSLIDASGTWKPGMYVIQEVYGR